jgi:hypothetical protein
MTDDSTTRGPDNPEQTTQQKMEHGVAVVGDLALLYARAEGDGKALSTVFAHTEQLSTEQLRCSLSVAVAAVTEFRKELMSTMFAALSDAAPTLN